MLHGYLNQAQVWVAESKAQVAQAQGRVDRLLEQIVLARRRMFGASSEQSDGQGHLFNEAEALALGSTEEQDLAVIPEVKDPATPKTPADRTPPRGKRAPLPTELERVEVLHDVPESERLCPCGTPMVCVINGACSCVTLSGEICPSTTTVARMRSGPSCSGAKRGSLAIRLRVPKPVR